MSSIQRPPNQLLQALPAAEFEALCPRLRPFEMVREAVLAESGAASLHVYLPHAGAISVVVRLSEGQTVEGAMIGRDGVVGASEALGDGISAILAQAQQSAACNASHSVEARLSRWLLHARDLWDGTTLPMTQELLARLIGVQRNAISMVAHALLQARIIGYRRGRIEILDSQALQATACECYQTVKAKCEQLLTV